MSEKLNLIIGKLKGAADILMIHPTNKEDCKLADFLNNIAGELEEALEEDIDPIFFKNGFFNWNCKKLKHYVCEKDGSVRPLDPPVDEPEK